uniref:Uncharacterized protein n=1 Tax=Hippocampus comes TaxID=109280 RepID=A0A3Q2YNE5_HIPCM
MENKLAYLTDPSVSPQRAPHTGCWSECGKCVKHTNKPSREKPVCDLCAGVFLL